MKEDIQAYLDRVRKTIADSRRLVSQAELRIAETDRMLEKQGLTREQLMSMRFSEAQMEAVNAELKRRGLDPLERWERDLMPGEPDESPGGEDGDGRARAPETTVRDAELENRQRKFGMMMRPFQL